MLLRLPEWTSQISPLLASPPFSSSPGLKGARANTPNESAAQCSASQRSAAQNSAEERSAAQRRSATHQHKKQNTHGGKTNINDKSNNFQTSLAMAPLSQTSLNIFVFCCLFSFCCFYHMFLLIFDMIPSCGVQNSLKTFVLFFVFSFVDFLNLFLLWIWFNYLVYWFAPLSQVSVARIRILLVLIVV